jgi:hypothetical protein
MPMFFVFFRASAGVMPLGAAYNSATNMPAPEAAMALKRALRSSKAAKGPDISVRFGAPPPRMRATVTGPSLSIAAVG